MIFFIIYFTYIKVSKNLVKYQQENKEKLQKKARERYQSFSKEIEEKSERLRKFF